MNERIRELAEQVGADFMRRINYNNLEGEEYEEDAGVIFESNESFEKFAELIVKECAQVAFEGDLKRAIGQWGSHSDILIHFGIEHDVVKKFRGEE